MTVESIARVNQIGRDEVGRRTTIGLAEYDELCATATAGVRLADMLRGFVGPGAELTVDPRVVVQLRSLLKIAGFEP